MKLTPLQRYTAYCIMLQEAEDIGYYKLGMCFMIRDLFFWDSGASSVIINHFPELWSKRPPTVGDNRFATWFSETKSGWVNRKELLTQCIQELELKLFK